MSFQVQRIPKQGVKKMKTLISVAFLTIAFLSAGAFANSEVQPLKSNVTVVYKNQVWPVKGKAHINTCEVNRCVNI
jgi:hypothetical protein